jgi:putative Mg2+ transporter-C (MgtC) family protein
MSETGLLGLLWHQGDPAILALAFLLGALISLEREWFSHACGIRPCVLVAVATAAFGRLAIEHVPPSNLGNAFGAIATGVGFLGAGAILKQDRTQVVRGLSTAATIWSVAIVGLLVGVREIALAVMLTSAILLVNTLLRPFARWIAERRPGKGSADDVMDG